MSRDLYRSFPF